MWCCDGVAGNLRALCNTQVLLEGSHACLYAVSTTRRLPRRLSCCGGGLGRRGPLPRRQGRRCCRGRCCCRGIWLAWALLACSSLPTLCAAAAGRAPATAAAPSSSAAASCPISRSWEPLPVSPLSPLLRLPIAAACSPSEQSERCGAGAAAASSSPCTEGWSSPHHASGLLTRACEPHAFESAVQSAAGVLCLPARRPTTHAPRETSPPTILSSHPTQSGAPS